MPERPNKPQLPMWTYGVVGAVAAFLTPWVDGLLPGPWIVSVIVVGLLVGLGCYVIQYLYARSSG